MSRLRLLIIGALLISGCQFPPLTTLVPAPPPAPAAPTPPTAVVIAASPTNTPSPTVNPTPPADPAEEDRPKVIVLDPGHGGYDSEEAYNRELDLREGAITLDVSLRAAALLREAGYQVVLTRETDQSVDPTYHGGGYTRGLYRDLQARIDIANAAQADLLISIHHNASPNPDKSGIEVWYNSQRSFADRNRVLGRLAYASLKEELEEAGHPVTGQGVLDDRLDTFSDDPFYLLGPGSSPQRGHEYEPTRMPSIIVENLFLSHPDDALALTRPEIRQTLARGYLKLVDAYFAAFPD